jgi:hypothetical protein
MAEPEEMMDAIMSINDGKKSGSEEVDEDPPDNGAWYCSMCNWLGTIYDRFDKPFVTFFMI